MGETIRLDLERLRALPLDLPARLTLWRELRILQRRGTEATAAHAAADGTVSGSTTGETNGCDTPLLDGAAGDGLDGDLRRLLVTDQLARCRELALQGHWRDASLRIASLRGELEALGLSDALARLLMELLEPLQRLLLAPPDEKTSRPAQDRAAELDTEDRAELLWQAHSWLRLLEDHGLPGDGHGGGVAGQAEPIARLGAIAWLEHFQQAREPAEQLRALIRSQRLLIAVAEAHQPCPDWVALALRDGLRAGLIWLGRGLPPAELLRWSLAYVASVLPEAQRERALQQLWPAEAALEVGRALKLGSLSAR